MPINGNPTINGSWVVAFTQPNPASRHATAAAHPQAALPPATATPHGLQLPLNQPQLQLQLLATGFEFCTTRRR
jgi:hypothetical protein